MEMNLKKIECYGMSNRLVKISFTVRYAWENRMYNDLINIHFNGNSQKSYLTVQAKNQGVHLVLEKIIQTLSRIELQENKDIILPAVIIDNLTEIFNLKYEYGYPEKALASYNS